MDPGQHATISSVPANVAHVIVASGSCIVIDGLEVASSSLQGNEYDIVVSGDHVAVLDIELHPASVPFFKGGLQILGSHNLVYRSYLHDYGSPDSIQNPAGNGGFVLAVLGSRAKANTIWSNHLTRGGHDVSLCKGGCAGNRWLNNVMDGGWGMGWEAVNDGGLGADGNLFEGNQIFHVGRLISAYKPSIEISSSGNTVRRNLIVNGARGAIEESAFGGPAASNLVYNNTIYSSGWCLFVSAKGGVPSYDHNVFANNICYKFSPPATMIYPGNTTNDIANNAFSLPGADGKIDSDQKILIWNQSAAGDYQYPKTVDFADRSYNPPFSGNAPLQRLPNFEDEDTYDFRLKTDSELRRAGIHVADQTWGSPEAPPDLGAFGLTRMSHQIRRSQ